MARARRLPPRSARSPRPARPLRPTGPPVERRPLLSAATAARLAEMYKLVANPTRLRLLHALVRTDELCVGELAAALAMTPQAISNQLQRLTDKGVVESRRSGNNVYYRVVEECVPCLLEQGLCLMKEARPRR